MLRILLLLLCFPLATLAQSNKKKQPAFNKRKQEKAQSKFLEKQWWLGIKAGPTLSGVEETKVYDVIQPIDYDGTINKKTYSNFKDLGTQVSLEAGFYFKGFTFTFQPAFHKNNFQYSNQYLWGSTTVPTNQLQLNYSHTIKLDYLVLPFDIRYEFTRTKLRPYIHAGVYSTLLIQGVKEISISGTDQASGGVNPFKDQPLELGATNLFSKNNWGIQGGLGACYTVGNVRFILDLNYMYGMSNITSANNRYSNDSLAGVGDVLNDFKLSSLNASVGCLFPLRFLENSFKSTVAK